MEFSWFHKNFLFHENQSQHWCLRCTRLKEVRMSSVYRGANAWHSSNRGKYSIIFFFWTDKLYTWPLIPEFFVSPNFIHCKIYLYVLLETDYFYMRAYISYLTHNNFKHTMSLKTLREGYWVKLCTSLTVHKNLQ